MKSGARTHRVHDNSMTVSMTNAHNAVRKNASPKPKRPIPPLEWSDALADDSQKWANRCIYKHSHSTKYGENMFAKAGESGTPQEVVSAWASESAHYDYNTNTCKPGKVCGHYTQVVWRDTTKLGCGVKSCTTGSPFVSQFATWEFWVCRYSPPGNVTVVSPSGKEKKEKPY